MRKKLEPLFSLHIKLILKHVSNLIKNLTSIKNIIFLSLSQCLHKSTKSLKLHQKNIDIIKLNNSVSGNRVKMKTKHQTNSKNHISMQITDVLGFWWN